jgi:hypothetical protein
MANAKVTKLKQRGESPKAYKYVQLDRDNREGPEFWIPKSQIEHRSQLGEDVTLEIPEWLAEEKELDYH